MLDKGRQVSKRAGSRQVGRVGWCREGWVRGVPDLHVWVLDGDRSCMSAEKENVIRLSLAVHTYVKRRIAAPPIMWWCFPACNSGYYYATTTTTTTAAAAATTATTTAAAAVGDDYNYWCSIDGIML